MSERRMTGRVWAPSGEIAVRASVAKRDVRQRVESRFRAGLAFNGRSWID